MCNERYVATPQYRVQHVALRDAAVMHHGSRVVVLLPFCRTCRPRPLCIRGLPTTHLRGFCGLVAGHRGRAAEHKR